MLLNGSGAADPTTKTTKPRRQAVARKQFTLHRLASQRRQKEVGLAFMGGDDLLSSQTRVRQWCLVSLVCLVPNRKGPFSRSVSAPETRQAVPVIHTNTKQSVWHLPDAHLVHILVVFSSPGQQMLLLIVSCGENVSLRRLSRLHGRMSESVRK